MNDDEVARIWDENAAAWTSGVRAGLDVYRDAYNNPAFLRFLGSVNDLDVLDAGCGEGTNTRLVAAQGARVVGIDVSPRMIACARQVEEREPLGIEYGIGSMTDLTRFGAARFDVVVSTMALMDAPDFEGAVRAFARVLRPGGRVAFSITHPCFTNVALGWEEVEGTPVLRIAGYAEVPPVVESWSFRGAEPGTRPFRIAYFPRTISQIVGALSAADLSITRMEEPVPTEDACVVAPALHKHRAIPHFLYVEAEKRD